MKHLFWFFFAGALFSCQFDAFPLSGDEVTSSISISGSAFRPGTARTTVGQEVTFTNRDGTAHSVRWRSVPAAASSSPSGSLNTNQSYAYTPVAVGEYAYQCGIHSSMNGRLVVTAAAP